MKPVSPVLPDQPDTHQLEIVIAKDQPEYLPLPALCVHQLPGGLGEYVQSLGESEYIITRWELTDEEIERLKETKSLYFYQWNFAGPLSPVMLDVEPPRASNEKSSITEPIES